MKYFACKNKFTPQYSKCIWPLATNLRFCHGLQLLKSNEISCQLSCGYCDSNDGHVNIYFWRYLQMDDVDVLKIIVRNMYPISMNYRQVSSYFNNQAIN